MGACQSNVSQSDADNSDNRTNRLSDLFGKIYTNPSSPWFHYLPVYGERGSRQSLRDSNMLHTYNAVEKENGTPVSVQQIFLNRRVHKNDVLQTLNEIRKMSHPGLPRLHCAYVAPRSIFLVVNSLKGAKDLAHFLADQNTLPLALVISIARQIATIVNYLHKQGFYHGFLSPSSFVVLPADTTAGGGGGKKNETTARAAGYVAPATPRVVLKDFGLERKFGRTVDLLLAVDHAPYLCPEIAKSVTRLSLRCGENSLGSCASDVFSMGAMLYFMLTGRNIFEGASVREILEKVQSETVNDSVFVKGTPGQYIPKAGAALILTMMESLPEKRISMPAVLESGFLADISVDDKAAMETATFDEKILSNLKGYVQGTVVRRLLIHTVNYCLDTSHNEHIASQFETIDKDNSGYVDIAEFKEAYAESLLSEAQLESLFKVTDLDNSGKIDYREFVSASRALDDVNLNDRLLRAFETWDVDGNGYIDAADVRKTCNGLYGEEDIAKILSELALTDENGKIFYTEFLKIADSPSETRIPRIAPSLNMKEAWTQYRKGDPMVEYERTGGGALGEGMTGKVYQIRNRQTGVLYAGKQIRFGRSPGAKERLKNEIRAMVDMDHPNIVRLHEIFELSSSLYLVLELCSGGELYDDLIGRVQYTERHAADLFFQMLSSVAYVHRRGIAHRDLKLENFIFQSKNKNAPLKLIDFGLSKREGSGLKRMRSVVGTAYYMAPEVVDRKSKYRVGKKRYYTKQCDMWSLGVLLYMMLCGQPPFNGRDNAEIIDSIMDGNYSTFEIRSTSLGVQDLLSRLLEIDPDQRLTAEEALKHPWFDIRNKDSNPDHDKPLTHIVANIKSFHHMCRLKQTVMSLVAFDLTDADVEELRQTFLTFDKDNSGSLSLSEFRQAMAGKVPEEGIIELFKSIDYDGSGSIAYSEFLSATIHASHVPKVDKLSGIFHRLDVDGNGILEVVDLRRICKGIFSEEEMNRMIAAADKNGDGNVEYEEFLEMMAEKDAV